VKRIADQTLYEILEVPPDAPPAEIELACARAIALYGPGSLATYTLMTSDEAALLGRRVEEAKVTLLDSGARARYDEALARPGEGRGAAGANGSREHGFGSMPPVIPPAASSEAPAAGPILLHREVAVPEAPEPAAAPPSEPAVPEGGAWTGDVLRRIREARGITVRQIADRTKVTRHHIENIEDEKFGVLPAQVYLRGILLALARELRLDGQKVARSYLERMAAAAAEGGPKPR